MHIYDKEFIQRELPMTKQEVRAISIAKLQLEESCVLIDVGAGTGTIAIEAARYLKKGKVFAIEKEIKGIGTLRENIEKIGVKNVEVIVGRAPEKIPNVEYDRMFIGGSTGSMRSIVQHFMKYSAERARVVINIITLESLNETVEILKEFDFSDVEIVNVMISRAKKAGNYTMMYGENPIYIITAIKGKSV